MKNKSILLIIAASFLLGCSGERPYTSYQYDGLKGNVKSIFSYVYEAESRFGKIEKGNLIDNFDMPYWIGIEPACYAEYNNDGNLVKKTTYLKDGELAGITEYEYVDGKTSLIRESGSDGEIYYCSKYTYEKGKLVGIASSSSYDKRNGREHHYSFENGKVTADSIFTNGELASIVNYLSNNEDSIVTVEKDVNGKEISRFYQSMGKYRRPLMIESTYANGSDFNGYKMQFTYNEDGWETLVKRDEPNEDCKVIKFEYIEFDNKGNWTSRAIYANGELVALEENTIEYF